MSLNEKRVLVFGTGGTIVSGGRPLRPIMSKEDMFEDEYVPRGMRFIFRRLSRLWDSGNVKVQDIGDEVGQTIYDLRGEIDGAVIGMGTGQSARIMAALSLLFRYTLDKPLLGLGSATDPTKPESDVKIQKVSVLRTIDAFIEEEIIGAHWPWRDKVFSGSRLMKIAPDNFDTPGRPPVATFSDGVVYMDPSVPRKVDLTSQEPELHKRFSLAVHSGMYVNVDDNIWVLKAMAGSKKYKAVILIVPDPPTRPWGDSKSSWVDAIEYATARDMIVFILFPWQPCRVNLVPYQLGDKAKKAGAVGLLSYTPAMAEMMIRQGLAECHGDRDKTIDFVSNDLVRGQLPESSKSAGPKLSARIA